MEKTEDHKWNICEFCQTRSGYDIEIPFEEIKKFLQTQ